MYSMNLEPHVSVGDGAFRAAFDIDEHYISECRDRAITLEKDPGMHYVSAPHMMEAQWDLLELIMESYARDYPQYFSLEREGRQWHWTNRCWTSTTLHLRRPGHPALRADGVHHPPGPGRLGVARGARRHTVLGRASPPSAPTIRCASTSA
jgi:hypothetical protein